MPSLAARLITAGLATTLAAALAGCDARVVTTGLATEPLPSPPDAAAAGEPGAPSAPDAAADDAGAPSAEDPGNAFEPRCGLPPYRRLHLGVRDVMSPADSGSIAGAKVTLKHCPDQSFALTGEGASIQVTAGAETWIRFDAPGYIPWIEGEMLIPEASAVPYLEATMMPRGVADIVMPVWKPDAPTIYVEVRTGRTGADDACRTPAGVALAVKGWPSAVVLYRNKGANADYSDGNGTSAEGVAVVTNLPVGLPSVELVAAKVGCNYLPAFGDANSAELLPIARAPLFPGAITHQVFNPSR